MWSYNMNSCNIKFMYPRHSTITGTIKSSNANSYKSSTSIAHYKMSINTINGKMNGRTSDSAMVVMN